jgi:hypothetical protein
MNAREIFLLVGSVFPGQPLEWRVKPVFLSAPFFAFRAEIVFPSSGKDLMQR